MKKYVALGIMTIFGVSVVGVVSGATRIVLPDSAASASTVYANRDAKYAINGAGLTGDQHTADAANLVAWMNSSGQSIAAQWFMVDFGVVTPLDRFKMWNFNWKHATVDTLARGVKECVIYISDSESAPGSNFSDSSVWTFVMTNSFAKAPGLNSYTGEPDVSLLGNRARWLAIDIRSNHGGDTVGISELQFFSDDAPIVLSEVPLDVLADSATLPGALAFSGGQPTDVFAFLGTADGGTVSSAWDTVFSFGLQPVGTLSTNVSVAAGTEYFFRFQALNSGGTNWSDSAAFYTGPISVDMPASIAEGAITLPVIFRRPVGVTNTALELSFSVSGDVRDGLDYNIEESTVTLPAGEESVQVDISLTDDLIGEPDEQLVVTLNPGPFVMSAVSSNTTIVVDDDGYLDTTQWDYHMSVTASGYSGLSSLTDFPIVLRLSEELDGFSYADFTSPLDGGDLRVTDSVTGQTLVHEIESWNPAGTSIVWVSVADLFGTASSVTLHWGNEDASLPGYAVGGGAWNPGFSGVWHLNQSSGIDSSANNNDGAAHGNITAPGILGDGQFFDGNDYISVPNDDSLGADTTSSLTVSLWMNSRVSLSGTDDQYRMLEKGDNYFLTSGFNGTGAASFLIKQNNSVFSTGNGAAFASNEWHLVYATYDGTSMRIYVDGVFKSSKEQAGVIDNDNLPLRIGSDDSGKYFHGILDETRIEKVVRSADWIKACYDNQKQDSSFLTYGKVDAPPGGTVIMIL